MNNKLNGLLRVIIDYLGVFIIFLYLITGSIIILYPVRQGMLPVPLRISLGLLLVTYGVFRAYRKINHKNENNTLIILYLWPLVVIGHSCAPGKSGNENSTSSGEIRIAADETYQPVMEAELMVFQGTYNNANIHPVYVPEQEAFELLMKDSVQFLLASRLLSDKEVGIFNDRKIYPRQTAVATDAMAFIVNPSNADTIMTVENIRGILSGKITKWAGLDKKSKLKDITVVFDNQHSSTVRFAADTICHGLPLSPALTALEKNTEVVKYVSSHKNALGIIGLCWISNQNDSTHLSFLKEIRVVALTREAVATWDNSYRPYQAYLYYDFYPYSRKVYIIDTEPRNGLATGLAAFIAGEKGQRIILKSGIVPATAPTRVVDVTNSDVLH